MDLQKEVKSGVPEIVSISCPASSFFHTKLYTFDLAENISNCNYYNQFIYIQIFRI